MFSIRQLRYALAVWREGSFVRAAEALNVSQPAISGQVRQFEQELGFALFKRTGHGIEVTEIGRTFLMQAEPIYFGNLRLTDMARQLRGGPAGSFAIGISSGIDQVLVPEIFAAISAVKPQARLELTTTTTRRINQLLLEERIDIGVTVETNPRALSRDLISEPVSRDEMVLIVPCKHRLARRRSVEIDELADEPLIMNELSVGYGEIVLSMFNDRSLRPDISAVSDNVETMKAIVRAGGGVALVPRFSAELDAAHGLLRMLNLEPGRTLEIMLVRRQRKMSLVAETFAGAIRDRLMRAGSRETRPRRPIKFRNGAIRKPFLTHRAAEP